MLTGCFFLFFWSLPCHSVIISLHIRWWKWLVVTQHIDWRAWDAPDNVWPSLINITGVLKIFRRGSLCPRCSVGLNRNPGARIQLNTNTLGFNEWVSEWTNSGDTAFHNCVCHCRRRSGFSDLKLKDWKVSSFNKAGFLFFGLNLK